MLREIIDENRTPELPGLPTFTGGLGGYFSYDYIKYSEPKLRLSDEEKTEIKPQFSEEKYEKMVEKAKHYIREGDIFHGMKSYFCQDEYGQIAPVYSISAGLDYPGVGPEHAHLYDLGRAKYVPVTDDEAVDAFEYLSRIEGIIPALESAHAVAYAKKIVPQMDKDEIVVITLSGRGDKDCAALARYSGEDIHE